MVVSVTFAKPWRWAPLTCDTRKGIASITRIWFSIFCIISKHKLILMPELLLENVQISYDDFLSNFRPLPHMTVFLTFLANPPPHLTFSSNPSPHINLK